MHSVIILYDSKILRIQCVFVSLYLQEGFLLPTTSFLTFYLQFSGVRASSHLSCEYVNCNFSDSCGVVVQIVAIFWIFL